MVPSDGTVGWLGTNRTLNPGEGLHGWVWSTVFWPTPEEWSQLCTQPQRVVFQIGDQYAPPIAKSAPFTFAEDGKGLGDCSFETARLCGGFD
jgi:hypothetical protein